MADRHAFLFFFSLLTAQKSFTFTHSHADDRGCQVSRQPAHQEQFMVQYLGHGYFHVQLGEPGKRTSMYLFPQVVNPNHTEATELIEHDSDGLLVAWKGMVKCRILNGRPQCRPVCRHLLSQLSP